MEKFETVLSHVADLNADRLKLTANMAEDSQRVKVDFSPTFEIKICDPYF